MVEIPDSLRSVFSAPVRERDGSYVIEIPASEIEHETLTVDDTYRIAIFESHVSPATSAQDTSRLDRPQPSSDRGPPEPPVDEGEVRKVTIETVGDQGDGIAKVDRGYVVVSTFSRRSNRHAARPTAKTVSAAVMRGSARPGS